MRPRDLAITFKTALFRWNDDNALRLSAALAYYTIFSIAPLLIIVTAIAGLVFGQDAVRGEIDEQLRGLIGEDGAGVIETMIAGARGTDAGLIASLVGVVTLLLGATGVFGELQASLNQIWRAEPPKTSGVTSLVKTRFVAFTMVVVIGFLLLTSLAVSALLAAAGKYLGTLLPIPPAALEAANALISFGVITFLFAMIYRILPDVHIPWSDVWTGAAVTSLLFTLGKSLIGLYLGRSGVATTYGAAGSLVVLLMWIYYSAVILFFGAEFTKVYSERHGSQSGPEPA